MINILSLTFSLTLFKLLIEESLLIILMTMEMASMLAFFLVLNMNLVAMGYTSCVITILSVMISESVLSLSIFINLMRFSSSEKVSSFSLGH